MIVNRISELLEEKHITRYQLKENAEISTTIYQWRKNATRDADRMPSLRSIEKICNFIGVSLSYFFAIDKSEQTDIRRKEAISVFEKLTDEEIDALLFVVKTFKKI